MIDSRLSIGNDRKIYQWLSASAVEARCILAELGSIQLLPSSKQLREARVGKMQKKQRVTKHD